MHAVVIYLLFAAMDVPRSVLCFKSMSRICSGNV